MDAPETVTHHLDEVDRRWRRYRVVVALVVAVVLIAASVTFSILAWKKLSEVDASVDCSTAHDIALDAVVDAAIEGDDAALVEANRNLQRVRDDVC